MGTLDMAKQPPRCLELKIFVLFAFIDCIKTNLNMQSRLPLCFRWVFLCLSVVFLYLQKVGKV